MITALAGGVGAARFLEGLVKIIKEEALSVIVNTGDDIELYGLHISPDLDTVMYTLAGIVDENRGWGIKDDSFQCLEMLRQYGFETWFKLGNKDLATHIYRTHLLKRGLKLSEVTMKLCQALGIKVKILPMSDDKIETLIVTDSGTMHFQEYLVKRSAQDTVIDVRFDGIEKGRPAPGVLDSISESDIVILCPSNPIVSTGTILSVDGVKNALKESKAKVIAISPIVDGAPIKGPADKLMRGLGLEVSAYGVASLYRDFLDSFIIDTKDKTHKRRIEALDMSVTVTNTIMNTVTDKIKLARVVLDLAGR